MDKCPLDGKPCPNERILHVTETDNGGVKEFHFCETCSLHYLKKINQEQFFPPPVEEKPAEEKPKDDFIGGLPIVQTKIVSKPQKSSKAPCPYCGITAEEISSGGRFGCDRCYIHFTPEMESALFRIHGATKHVGKIPKKWAEEKEKRLQTQEEAKDIDHQIVNLKLKMAKAIEAENYEVAGVLKQKIEELQRRKATS